MIKLASKYKTAKLISHLLLRESVTVEFLVNEVNLTSSEVVGVLTYLYNKQFVTPYIGKSVSGIVPLTRWSSIEENLPALYDFMLSKYINSDSFIPPSLSVSLKDIGNKSST